MPCDFSPENIQRVVDFHGHSCPGLAIGIRAAELALRRLPPSEKSELVALVETDMCGVDAIQFLTGCTLGKGNLIHRDHGKMAFSFFDRRSGDSFRALLRPEARGDMGREMSELIRRKTNGSASEADLERLDHLRESTLRRYMDMDLEEMFEILPTDGAAPRRPQILNSLVCEDCGESAMESRTRRFDGRTLCIPCFEAVEQKT